MIWLCHQVEILARVCRKWTDEDTLDPEAVKLAEMIIKVRKFSSVNDRSSNYRTAMASLAG